MASAIETLQQNISGSIQKVVQHKVYQTIDDLAALRTFMRYHVYAVWDFMSLLKALQLNLTCTSIPWFPVGSGLTRSLINEIVAGEEADDDFYGEKKSHFEMYLDAMEQCGADTAEIKRFVSALQSGKTLAQAYQIAGTPAEAQTFVNFTFQTINSGKVHQQAAAFTFGREDLIPAMFRRIVYDLDSKFPAQLSLFKYYLDRHIEIDGGSHGHLALHMTTELCGQSLANWNEAEVCSSQALNHRINLWDGVYRQISAGNFAHTENQ